MTSHSIRCSEPSCVSATRFTRSGVLAAPVVLTKSRARQDAIREVRRRLLAAQRVSKPLDFAWGKFVVHGHCSRPGFKLSRSAASDRRRWLLTVLIDIPSVSAISIGSSSS